HTARARARGAESVALLLAHRAALSQPAVLRAPPTLQRQGRHEEAAPHLRIASALAGDFDQA
ncbi:hypothetical protein ACFXGE_20490, partial [Streptomyces sp. NPDC059378]